MQERDRTRKPQTEQQGKQVRYQNRYVDYYNFRVFVYAKDGTEKLATNYEEYVSLVGSGKWFSTKDEAAKLDKPEKAIKEVEENREATALDEIKAIKEKVRKGK
jgi:hypothetical protein